MRFKFLVLGLFLTLSAQADVGKGEAFNLYIENDSRHIGGPGSDNAYSSGLKLSYIAAEDDIPSWGQATVDRFDLLRDTLKSARSNFGISLGHQIYTPNDTERADLIDDDRPYAAWLYMGFSARFQNEVRSHSLELDVGVIGPDAQGEKVQNGFHRLIGTDQAKGWSNQLGDEPTLELSYQQRLRFFELRSNRLRYFDAIPFFGGSVGNVSVDAHVGGMVRTGNLLPNDFGPTRPSMTNGDNFVTPISDGLPQTTYYAFAAVQGFAVARNVFLDGNTFHASHRVTKYPFVFETEFGFAGLYRQWSGTWRFVSRSPEFEQKSVVNSFASISVSYAY
jgi:lipid A 3-O-deacylase